MFNLVRIHLGIYKTIILQTRHPTNLKQKSTSILTIMIFNYNYLSTLILK